MAKNQYQLVTFFLNGKEVERMVDVRASLTDMQIGRASCRERV